MHPSSPILVTGAAGFIGHHVAARLLDDGCQVVGIDNLNDYYSVELKRDRLAQLEPREGFQFCRLDLGDRGALQQLLADRQCTHVVHMAAQAGVRYAAENPAAYVDSNLVGFASLLECCRQAGIAHLLFASSSSVYGADARSPFSESHPVDHPISLYAATKRSNELMAHSYSHLFRLPVTGVRFFTVYGPWGRPDMALWRFVEAILGEKPLQVYNEGRMTRDYTFVRDAAEAVVRLLDHSPAPVDAGDPAAATPSASATAPFRIYNVGNRRPISLLDLIRKLEQCIGKSAELQLMPMQPGDVPDTCANIDAIGEAVGFAPGTPIDEGLAEYVEWHLQYARRSR